MEPSSKTKEIAGLMMSPGKSPKLSRSIMSEDDNASPNSAKCVKNPSLVTIQGKSPNPSRSSKGLGFGENVNPNLMKSEKESEKSVPRDSRLMASPINLMRERRFVVAKRKGSNVCDKCKPKGVKKCICLAYQSLRASQETFFYNQSDAVDASIERSDLDLMTTKPRNCSDGVDNESEVSSAMFKQNRDKLFTEASESVPETGSGRVIHLVKAFEKLRTMKNTSGDDEVAVDEMRNDQTNAEDEAKSSFDGSFASVSSGTAAGGGGKSRRNSTESFGRRRCKKKQLRITNQKPFKLRTEQRGRMKEEELMIKIRKMMDEQERLRVPIAQGLPWTTDEPECLVKPPAKEITQPIDLTLHSDIRAADRAEFDHKVAEKMSLIERYKMERERQQKLEEEEEIKRLRKELVPKAQPMPYFDRPFIPRRSEKSPTIPKDPKFHVSEHKKIRCMSMSDFESYTYLQ